MPNDLQSDKPFKLLDQPVSRPALGLPLQRHVIITASHFEAGTKS